MLQNEALEVFALLLCMAHTRLDNPFLSVARAVITGLLVLWIYVLLVSSLMNLQSWALISRALMFTHFALPW